MARPCSICSLTARGAIDDLLRSGRSVASVAADFEVSYQSLARHARSHVVRSLPDDPGPDTVLDPLVELVASLRRRALGGSDVAAREYRLALLSLEARQASAAPEVDLTEHPDWIRLQRVQMAALARYPEARQAVANAIGAVLDGT